MAWKERLVPKPQRGILLTIPKPFPSLHKLSQIMIIKLLNWFLFLVVYHAPKILIKQNLSCEMEEVKLEFLIISQPNLQLLPNTMVSVVCIEDFMINRYHQADHRVDLTCSKWTHKRFMFGVILFKNTYIQITISIISNLLYSTIIFNEISTTSAQFTNKAPL